MELTLEASALPLFPQALVPEFDFDTYLGALMPRKLNDTESVVIYALPYYQKLTNLLKGTKKRFVGMLGWDMQMGKYARISTTRFSKPQAHSYGYRCNFPGCWPTTSCGDLSATDLTTSTPGSKEYNRNSTGNWATRCKKQNPLYPHKNHQGLVRARRDSPALEILRVLREW